MSRDVQGMRRRWVIEVHKPGAPVSHVTDGERVRVYDDVGDASQTLDHMQGSLDPSTVVYKLAPHHCWCLDESASRTEHIHSVTYLGKAIAKERDELRAQLEEARERNLEHLGVIEELGHRLEYLTDHDAAAKETERLRERVENLTKKLNEAHRLYNQATCELDERREAVNAAYRLKVIAESERDEAREAGNRNDR